MMELSLVCRPLAFGNKYHEALASRAVKGIVSSGQRRSLP
jgi:hypothetical protein